MKHVWQQQGFGGNELRVSTLSAKILGSTLSWDVARQVCFILQCAWTINWHLYRIVTALKAFSLGMMHIVIALIGYAIVKEWRRSYFSFVPSFIFSLSYKITNILEWNDSTEKENRESEKAQLVQGKSKSYINTRKGKREKKPESSTSVI